MQQRIQTWLSSAFDEQTQEKIKDLQKNNPKELEEAFYKDLEFGTGGMRGIVGVGTNRINAYTLGKNTQGLAIYLKKCFPKTPLKVAIAYDCRHDSKFLAEKVAAVFSANDIEVFLFSDLRPTPELSFAVRHLNCQAGIVLTASHNPPEYNGYKVYWQDGGQLVPPQDKELIDEIEKISYQEISFTAKNHLIHLIDSEIDQEFWKASVKHADFEISLKAKEDLKIVFTSLHGTSITALPQVLEKAGYKNLHIVKEQAQPNGSFPTVKSPNPEEPEALTLALKLAEQTNADIVIGTDPDADRLGVAVRNNKGEMLLLNGNQTMVLLTAFMLEQYQRKGILSNNSFIATTVVSTPMMFSIAEAYGVECKVGLTGFKWIAKMIVDFPEKKFICAGEESFGFMVKDFVRDKDAITSALLLCQMAAMAKEQGSNLYNELQNLYLDFGYYKEYLISLTKKGKEGAEEIRLKMKALRDEPLKEIGHQRVVFIEDYKKSVGLNLQTNETETLNFPASDVLIYYLEDGSKICVRPSGTEPKIKFYFSVNTPIGNREEIASAEKFLTEKIEKFIRDLNL